MESQWPFSLSCAPEAWARRPGLTIADLPAHDAIASEAVLEAIQRAGDPHARAMR